MKTIKYSYLSPISGKMEYNTDQTLTIKNSQVDKTFTLKEMEEISNAYKGINRFHKPLALLFWIDCKNGKFSNWK
mgnify:CR=1 FL=1